MHDDVILDLSMEKNKQAATKKFGKLKHKK
jgi:hypothetical protein